LAHIHPIFYIHDNFQLFVCPITVSFFQLSEQTKSPELASSVNFLVSAFIDETSFFLSTIQSSYLSGYFITVALVNRQKKIPKKGFFNFRHSIYFYFPFARDDMV